MLVVFGSVTLLFVVLGIAFANGKGLDLVAGYNTASVQEKAKIDPKALGACMAKMMFCLAAAWAVIGTGLYLGIGWLYGSGFALFAGVIVFFLIYMNTGNRLNKKN